MCWIGGAADYRRSTNEKVTTTLHQLLEIGTPRVQVHKHVRPKRPGGLIARSAKVVFAQEPFCSTETARKLTQSIDALRDQLTVGTCNS